MSAILVLVLAGAAFAVPQSPSRIVGGSTTSIEQYPYVANMQYLYFGFWWMQACGGSLLTTTTILSAAHCFDGDAASEWRVRLGSSFRSSGGILHAVSRLILHETYNNPVLDNDVAIVRLAAGAILSNSVQLARIAGPNFNLPDGATVTSIGWGDLEYDGFPSEILQHVETNVINQQLCADRYAYLKTLPGYSRWPDVSDGMLCAGILNVGGKDACQGDSGGPLAYQDDIIVGVTSWGFECADAFYPGVNARVSYYSNWILANGSM